MKSTFSNNNLQTILLILLVGFIVYNFFHTQTIHTDVNSYKDKIESLSNQIDTVKLINDKIGEPHPDAKTILTVRGFINSEKIRLNETEFRIQIENKFSETCNEIHYEVSDIKNIVEDDLFISFINKLDETEHVEEKKNQLREIAMRAMLEVKL